MKKWGILFSIFVSVVLVFAMSCKSPATSETPSPLMAADSESDSSSDSGSSSGSSGGGESSGGTTTTLGSLVIKMKDKPAEEADEIWVTISSIQVHFADEDEFILLPYDEFNYNLLLLKDNPATLNVATLEAGHYNQIRIEVTDGWLVFYPENGEGDSDKPELKIPSGKIKIPVQFHIQEGGTTNLVLDFDAEESIKVKKRGNKDSYIMTPVIKVADVSYQ